MPAQPPQINDASVTLSFGAAGVYYGYCTIADVQFEFTAALTQLAATLTNSVIAQEITYAANEMHNTLEHVYVMPYVGSNWGILATLRQMNAWLAFANIYEKYFQASAPDESPAAAAKRAWVELNIMDVVNGTTQWATPFGDATPQAMKAIYDLASGANVYPSPNDLDPNVANPIFSITGNTRYRKTDIL